MRVDKSNINGHSITQQEYTEFANVLARIMRRFFEDDISYEWIETLESLKRIPGYKEFILPLAKKYFIEKLT